MTPDQSHILLVDDEVRNLEVLEGILQSPEYRLVRASSANDALMALLHQEFAVIVLDVQMPGTSGIELAHLIKQRERTQHIPIIFLTAFYQDEQKMLESYKVGAVDYLTKPVNPHVLKSKVAVFADLDRKNAALRRSHAALEREVKQRAAAERALRETNDALESRVEARTAALREARDAAERSGRAKDSFLAALSHELRTPLNPVLLLASEGAANGAFPEEARAHFLSIRKNVELEARLIDDLLDLTRITHGKLVLDIRPVNFNRVLEDALATVRADAEQKQITLKLDLVNSPRQVAADPVRLQQVFWNILKNAVKFTPERGRILVTSRIDEATDAVTVAVTDNGIGLTPAELERVYDAFAQGDHATGGAHRFGGLGLGLTISRSLVEHHGGHLIASSEGPGKGATFSVELPLTVTSGSEAPADEDAVTGAAAATPAPTLAPGQSRRLLLVEDHEASRHTLAKLLRARAYDVKTAGSLADARRLLEEESFDYLISDIGLPDGTGFELMQEMKTRGAEVRGIALTGYGMEADVDRSREAGFLVHLTKPIVTQSLDRALAELHR